MWWNQNQCVIVFITLLPPTSFFVPTQLITRDTFIRFPGRVRTRQRKILRKGKNRIANREMSSRRKGKNWENPQWIRSLIFLGSHKSKELLSDQSSLIYYLTTYFLEGEKAKRATNKGSTNTQRKMLWKKKIKLFLWSSPEQRTPFLGLRNNLQKPHVVRWFAIKVFTSRILWVSDPVIVINMTSY